MLLTCACVAKLLARLHVDLNQHIYFIESVSLPLSNTHTLTHISKPVLIVWAFFPTCLLTYLYDLQKPIGIIGLLDEAWYRLSYSISIGAC